MDKKTLIVANWKMNPVSKKEVSRLLDSVKNEINSLEKTEIVFAPPFVYLSKISLSIKKQFSLAAQDCFWENKGAYTGEISSAMLKDLGCQYVIVGHSERKKNFNETEEVVNRKIKAVLKNRLNPIVCIGEELRDSFDSQGRPINEMNLVVGDQIEKSLIGISEARLRDIVIAYEPVWAIGTGISCLSDDAMKAMLFIKKTISKLYSRSAAEKVRILYGGSVNSKNAAEYIKEAGFNGLLIGSASLNASEFVKIVKNVDE